MNNFEFENLDDDFEEPRKNSEHFEEEIKKLKDRLHDSGGGSTNIEALEEIVSYYF